jgi:hypothetical protein
MIRKRSSAAPRAASKAPAPDVRKSPRTAPLRSDAGSAHRMQVSLSPHARPNVNRRGVRLTVLVAVPVAVEAAVVVVVAA